MVANQILEEDRVSYHEKKGELGVGCTLFPPCHMSPGHGVFSVVEEFVPGAVRVLLAW